MKKFFFSLITFSLLLSSCSSDDNNITSADGRVGELKYTLAFEEAAGSPRAASSTAVPITSWSNVKQVQLFLYDPATGKVAYSYTVNPSNNNTQFTWTNIPIGTYQLAVVANMKSNSDNIFTSLTGSTATTATEWTDFNVKARNINSQIFADLKSTTFPTAYSSVITAPNPNSAYLEPAEIFTAYSDNVTIAEGVTTNLSATPLNLKREVALMRVRVDNKSLAKLANVKFDDPSASILIQRQPVGFGLKLGTFAGGIYATASNSNRIIVASSGATTFKTADPTATTYNPTKIIEGNYKLWRDVIVLPNAAKSATPTSPDANAVAARKYFLIISALAPSGYTLDDGTVLAAAKPVFWWGIIDGVFVENNIREVNLSIKSSGSLTPPTVPTQVGGLNITISAPQNWNTAIQTSNIEV